MLKSQYAILNALRDLKLTRFNEVLLKSKVSSRTLSKHLRLLVNRGLTQKQDRKYRITSVGVETLAQLADKLEKFHQHNLRLPSRRNLRDYSVEVTRISPSETCVAIIHIMAPRRGFSERTKIDRALTEAIRTIMECVPSDCKEYNVAISGTKRLDSN